MKPEKTNHENSHNAAAPGEFLAAQENHDLANEHDRLQWLAFCYVADELTTSQRANFEIRLSTDLQAQEALASAVELGGEIYRSYESDDGTILLDRAVRNSATDQSSPLSRILIIAAAVSVMAVVGYGLVQNSDQSTAHNNSPDQLSTAQLSILADDWIDSLDGDEIEIADGGDSSELSELADWDSEEFEQSIPVPDSSAENDLGVNDLGVDTSLISFYSEMLDSGQVDSLLNSESLKQKTGVEL